MSGSGGGGPYGGYGGGSVQTDCNIVEKTALNSPQAAAVAQLQVGTVLSVVLTNNNLSLAAQVPNGGAIVGSLTPQALADLIDCIMKKGRAYIATVTQIRGAYVEVEIRPK